MALLYIGLPLQVKSMLVPRLGDGAATQTISALTAAVVYSYASLPLDTAKTRMQVCMFSFVVVSYLPSIQSSHMMNIHVCVYFRSMILEVYNVFSQTVSALAAAVV
jgi:hypothetical protein